MVHAGSLLETCGHVDGVTGYEGLSSARVAGDHLTGIDADAQADGQAEIALVEPRFNAPTTFAVLAAARTARKGSSSWTLGMPKTAMTASPRTSQRSRRDARYQLNTVK